MRKKEGTKKSMGAVLLLTAASELAFNIVNCSALNAKELRREQGIWLGGEIEGEGLGGGNDQESEGGGGVTFLTAASELAFHTVNCSALNAEELGRE